MNYKHFYKHFAFLPILMCLSISACTTPAASPNDGWKNAYIKSANVR